MLIECGRYFTGEYHLAGIGNIIPDVLGQKAPDIQVGYRYSLNDTEKQFGGIVEDPLVDGLRQVTIDTFGRLILSTDGITAPVLTETKLLVADAVVIPAPSDNGNGTSGVTDKGLINLIKGYGYAEVIYGGKTLSIVDGSAIVPEVLTLTPAVIGPTGMEEFMGFDANYGTGAGTIDGMAIESLRIVHVRAREGVTDTVVTGSVSGTSKEVTIVCIGEISTISNSKADFRIQANNVANSFHTLLRVDEAKSAKASEEAGAGRVVWYSADAEGAAGLIGTALAAGGAINSADISVIPAQA